MVLHRAGLSATAGHSYTPNISLSCPNHHSSGHIKGDSGKRFLHGDLICRYTLFKYVSDIYVDSLCIINVKKINYEKSNLLRHRAVNK